MNFKIDKRNEENVLKVNIDCQNLTLDIPIEIVEERMQLMYFSTLDETLKDIKHKAEGYFRFHPEQNKTSQKFLDYLIGEIAIFKNEIALEEKAPLE